jgi:ABC-type antimicrobial peptide transport system permease subunit
MVSPDFFRTFGVETVTGPAFSDSNFPAGGAPLAVVVNRQFVERAGLTPESVIGRTATVGLRFEIAGVVDDIRFGSATDEVEAQLFVRSVPGRIWAGPATFYVRSGQMTQELTSVIRATITRIDPTRPITNLQTMEEQFRESTAVVRFFARTAAVFAVLATALAALGLYGVLAYAVAQRSREIGLRFALGAQPDRIRWLVLRQVARLALVGIVLGIAASWSVGYLTRGFLFGVDAGDPIAMVVAAAVLVAVMLGAAYAPARRASRVDPMTVLRHE